MTRALVAACVLVVACSAGQAPGRGAPPPTDAGGAEAGAARPDSGVDRQPRDAGLDAAAPPDPATWADRAVIAARL